MGGNGERLAVRCEVVKDKVGKDERKVYIFCCCAANKASCPVHSVDMLKVNMLSAPRKELEKEIRLWSETSKLTLYSFRRGHVKGLQQFHVAQKSSMSFQEFVSKPGTKERLNAQMGWEPSSSSILEYAGLKLKHRKDVSGAFSKGWKSAYHYYDVGKFLI